MEITKAKYIQFREQNSCIEAEVDGQTVQVPLNAEGNKEWDKIQELVKAGTLTIEDAD
tara:strand:- start:25 stop:198 length:174 start_codon:yes stop_codon:yes gene_type:complete